MRPATSAAAASASVLLVDDSPANLLALAAVLKPLNARLVQCSSGKEALDAIRRECFAVALVDVQMPEMDGFELAATARSLENGRELPIIFVTAIHRDDRYAKRGYAAGAADYITKPFDADIVRARVKAFVDLYEQRDAIRRTQVALRTRERDEALRRLMAFERIATAALETNELGVLLHELLGIFVRAAEAADAAAILLSDGNELRVQACVGLEEEAVEDIYSVAVGEGFAGRIAQGRVPIGITDASHSPLVHGTWLRARGTRGLYGVPLLHDGELLGVAYIGSKRASSFPDSDKSLFLAMAERASLAVAKQLKRARLHSTLSVAPAAICILRVPSFEYEFANPAYRAMFGGRDLNGFRGTDVGLGHEALELVRKAYVDGATQEHAELLFQTTEDRYLRFTAQPMKNHAGTVDGVLTFAVDVTEQVLARKRLIEHERERAQLLEREKVARAEAELANEAKDEFLATVSHELRTPLNAMLGWAVIARGKAPPDLEPALGIIERNARAQSRIIEDVLDISRIVSGKLRLETNLVDLSSVAKLAVETVRPAADAKGVVLHVQLDSIDPIGGDAERLQQIIVNLLSNGIKFTPPNGKVSVRVGSDDKNVAVSVSDTGQGIDPAFLPRVFEPFCQADGSPTRRHGGLGLGLAIVKHLVQAHGGVIRASSGGAGTGATFTFELPLRKGQSSERPSETCMPNNARGARLDGLRVLVVDDDDDARSLVGEFLEQRGATIVAAGSATAALSTFESFCPDIVVSDIAMPGGDGYGLIRAIRSLPADRGGRTPAIAMTAYTRAKDGERVFAAGFQSHLGKPLDLQRLAIVIANLSGVTFDTQSQDGAATDSAAMNGHGRALSRPLV